MRRAGEGMPPPESGGYHTDRTPHASKGAAVPALITHCLFGEEAVNRGAVPQLDGADVPAYALRAFCLGCQGPDPFFFAVTTPRGSVARKLAGAMHRDKVGEAFAAVRAGIARLPAADRPAGRAFAYGLLAHYALDRCAHPYVYAMEDELCGADEALADAHHEVHAIIESEIDCGVLDAYRGRSTAEVPPVSVLEGDPQATRPAGALMADVANRVFGLGLRPVDYEGALGDMRLCYRLIEPSGSQRTRWLGVLERAVRPHSQLAALAHRTDQGADNPSMNPRRRTWTDPFKGGASNEGFAEVFERALADYAGLIERFATGNDAELVQACDLDYSGRPLEGGKA